MDWEREGWKQRKEKASGIESQLSLSLTAFRILVSSMEQTKVETPCVQTSQNGRHIYTLIPFTSTLTWTYAIYHSSTPTRFTNMHNIMHTRTSSHPNIHSWHAKFALDVETPIGHTLIHAHLHSNFVSLQINRFNNVSLWVCSRYNATDSY